MIPLYCDLCIEHRNIVQFVLNTEKALDKITSSILLNRFWVHKFLDFQASSRYDICPTYWHRRKMYTWTCTQNPIIDIELMVWALPLLILMKKLKPFQDMIFVKLICVTRKFELENFQQNALIPTIRTCKQCSKIRNRCHVMSCQISTLSSFPFLALVFSADPPFPKQDLMCSLSCAIIAFLAFSDQTLASESTCDVENIWSRRLLWGRSLSETLLTCWVVQRAHFERQHGPKSWLFWKVD